MTRTLSRKALCSLAAWCYLVMGCANGPTPPPGDDGGGDARTSPGDAGNDDGGGDMDGGSTDAGPPPADGGTPDSGESDGAAADGSACAGDICGDANDDGTVDVSDVSTISEMPSGGLSACRFWRSDVNADGVVDSADASALFEWIAAGGGSIECAP